MSIGQARKEGEMVAILKDLDRGWDPIIFQVESVNLIWRNDPPDDVFRVGHTVHLGTGVVG